MHWIQLSEHEQSRIREAARHAWLAYRGIGAIQADVRTVAGVEPEIFQTLLAGDVWLQGFAYRDRGRAIIAFRGSTGISVHLRVNVRAWQTGDPPRHAGFESAFEQFVPQIGHWLSKLEPPLPRLTLTGHSLGGALAVRAAFALYSGELIDYRGKQVPKPSLERVILFGAPRVGTRAFADTYERLAAEHFVETLASPMLGEPTWLMTNQSDLVPRLPPDPPYKHVGKWIGVGFSPGPAREPWNWNDSNMVLTYLFTPVFWFALAWLGVRALWPMMQDVQHHLEEKYLYSIGLTRPIPPINLAPFGLPSQQAVPPPGYLRFPLGVAADDPGNPQ